LEKSNLHVIDLEN